MLCVAVSRLGGSRSVLARTDGVFRYVRLPRSAGALLFSGRFVFVYFGDFFEHGSLVWERLLVRSCLQYLLPIVLSFILLYLSRLSSFLGQGVKSRSMVEEDRRGPLLPVKRHTEKIYWPLRMDDTHSSRCVVSFLGGPETSFWEIQTRSTWQSRCVLCGCVGVGVMRHAYQLAQILRAQATSSPVSSRSLVTASNICVLRPSAPKCPPTQP